MGSRWRRSGDEWYGGASGGAPTMDVLVAGQPPKPVEGARVVRFGFIRDLDLEPEAPERDWTVEL